MGTEESELNPPYLIGWTLKEIHEAKTNGVIDDKWIVRLVKRDGHELTITKDFDLKRINITVENDVVLSQTIG